jgi:ribosomal protein L11 methyltransferase
MPPQAALPKAGFNGARHPAYFPIMPLGKKNTPPDTHIISKEIMVWVSESPRKMTPADLRNNLIQNYGLNSIQIKALIKNLVARGELAYSYEHGTTFVQKSYSKPVRVSQSVVLKPPGYRYRSEPRDVVIQVKPGASFGDGRHPTTRLAIRAIEFVLKELQPFALNRPCSALDIGTGSGVLVMTAVKLGVQEGLGIDVDSCARAEARENVKLNDLQTRITISDETLDDIQRSFSMVLANLRVPTLRKLSSRMDALTGPEGIVVLSGVRNHELDGLMTVYQVLNFECVWTTEASNWVGVVIKKG